MLCRASGALQSPKGRQNLTDASVDSAYKGTSHNRLQPPAAPGSTRDGAQGETCSPHVFLDLFSSPLASPCNSGKESPGGARGEVGAKWVQKRGEVFAWLCLDGWVLLQCGSKAKVGMPSGARVKPKWGCPVVQKQRQCGDALLVQEQGQAKEDSKCKCKTKAERFLQYKNQVEVGLLLQCKNQIKVGMFLWCKTKIEIGHKQNPGRDVSPYKSKPRKVPHQLCGPSAPPTPHKFPQAPTFPRRDSSDAPVFPHLGCFGRGTKEPNPLQNPKRQRSNKLGQAEPRQKVAAQKMHPGEVKPSWIMQTFRRRLCHRAPFQSPLPPCLQRVVFLLISK